MTIPISKVHATFFTNKSLSSDHPSSYKAIWLHTHSTSLIQKIKAVLKDYTKTECVMGSFLGLLFSGHWNRHHLKTVNKLINTPYECVEDLLFDLRHIKRQPGGSLDRRIRYISEEMNHRDEAFKF